MARNINNIKIRVYKDAFGEIFPTGKSTIIPCDHQKISQHPEGLSVQAGYTTCLVQTQEGNEFPTGSTAVPNLVKVYKLQVKGGHVFVSSDDYDAAIGTCNACCVS